MEITINTKFFTFNQNNSGGHFVIDEEHGVCECVIIEALNAEDAIHRLNKIGDKVDGFHSYCSCCGERWPDWIDDDDGTDTPMIYSEPIDDVKEDTFRKMAFVHYFNANFKKYIFSKK